MRYLILLFILSGCSTSRFYSSSALSEELKKNEMGLMLITDTLLADYQQNEKLLSELKKQTQSPFIIENLDQKLGLIASQKESFLKVTSHLRKKNEKLIRKVNGKEKIRQGDPIFREIENFAEDKNKEQVELIQELEKYQKASEEFKQLTLDSRMV